MTLDLEFLDIRERFLPVKLATLRERMLRDPRLSAEERQQLGKLFEMIAARFHFEFRAKLEELQTLYDPFDPDRDTLPLSDEPIDEPAQRAQLAQAFEELLLGANYVEMSHQQILACAEYQTQTGLVVHASLSDYAELRAFYRGIRTEERTYRPWLTPWRRKRETVHVFNRVAVLVRLARRRTQSVFLKLFKNVVAEDLEMLLPQVKIRMRMLDHLKIGSTMAGGLATAIWKAFTVVALSPWLFLTIMAGFVGAMVKGIFSFFSSKAKYMQALTASLYFQNLANNSSALAHLVDTAEAEECKELLLAYFFLYVERNHDFSSAALDRRVEVWLRDEFGLEVDFEISDAVRKLVEKELMVRRTSGPNAEAILKVYDLPSALRRLDEVWDGYYAYNNEGSADTDRLADADWPPYPVATLRRIDPADASPLESPVSSNVRTSSARAG